MEPTSHAFKENARKTLADDGLLKALRDLQTASPIAMKKMRDGLPEFDDLRAEARRIRDDVLDRMDFYLEEFEARVVELGGHVHWCATAEDARRVVLDLCRAAGAATVTKSKSMITEEIALNRHLEANGIRAVETDLGEYILQLAGEAPSHIVAPAVHKTKAQVSDLFHQHHRAHGFKEREDEAGGLVAQARAILRHDFLSADVGITGANFLIAETGASVIVTNEGNGDLTQTLPKTHIVVASLEKVVPTMEDATTLIRVLARSAAAQEITVYTTFSAGPKRAGDLDGPEAFHVVLLDNGRSRMLGSPARELLRCIRCGACMNHCPIYGIAGGHAYGWVYPGPLGAALNPVFLGLKETHHLPGASTFCGRCEAVCPVQIPIPAILRHWREQAFDERISSRVERLGLSLWARFATRPRLYRLATRLAIAVISWLGRGRGRFSSFPLARGWTLGRDLPAPEGGTFVAQFRRSRDRATKRGSR